MYILIYICVHFNFSIISLGDRISIIKIDVDKNQQIASQYQVRGVPTMILFQNGKQLWRQSGVLNKEEIIKIILEKSNE
jgi:thioredoxin 1